MLSNTVQNCYDDLAIQIRKLSKKSITMLGGAYTALVNNGQFNKNDVVLLTNLFYTFLESSQSEKQEKLSKLLEDEKKSVTSSPKLKTNTEKIVERVGANAVSQTQDPGELPKGSVLENTNQPNKDNTLSEFLQKIIDLYSSETNKQLFCNICQQLLREVVIQLTVVPAIDNEMKDRFIQFIKQINTIQSGYLSLDSVFTNKFTGNETTKLIQEETNCLYYSFINEFKNLLTETSKKNSSKTVNDFYNGLNQLLQEGTLQTQLRYLHNNEHFKKAQTLIDSVLNKETKRDRKSEVKQKILRLLTDKNPNLLLKADNLEEFVDNILNTPDFTKASKLNSKINELEKKNNNAIHKKEELENEIKKANVNLNKIHEIIESYSEPLQEVKREKDALIKQIKEYDSIKAQSIAIPFELWYLEANYTCIIFIGERKKRIKFVLQLRHSNKNGELIQIRNNIYTRIYFTHKHFRREGDDVVYYINDSDIPKDRRVNVIHPNGSRYQYSYVNFKDNQIITEGRGFTNDLNSSKGRFIIRKVSNINLLSPSENELIKKREDDASKIKELIDREDGINYNKESANKKLENYNSTISHLEEQKQKYDSDLNSFKEEIKDLRLELSQEEKRINEDSSKDLDKIRKKILAKAIEENRIIIYSCNHSNEIKFIDAAEGSGIKFSISGQSICFLDSKEKDLRTKEGERWSSILSGKLLTFYYHLIEELKFTNKEEAVPNDNIIFETLFSDQQIIIFNVDIPSSYNEKYIPIAPCKRKAFDMDEPNRFMVFPVKTPKCPTRFVFKNGYYSGTPDGGIILINVSFKEDEQNLGVSDNILPSVSPRKPLKEGEKRTEQLSVENSSKAKQQQLKSSTTDTQKSLGISDIWELTFKDQSSDVYAFKKDGKMYGTKLIKTSSKSEQKPGDVFDYQSEGSHSSALGVYCLRSVDKSKKKNYKKCLDKELEFHFPENFKKTYNKDFFGVKTSIGSDYSTNISDTSIILPIESSRVGNKYYAIFEYEPNRYIGVTFNFSN
ncbi:hypothetical protein, conserved [Entamoeba dispar SAW760]|uniref:Uncharacterized protein n=1 Tax=Entamoeba dispar (strain ATCC PRA-260 / SAW760) TaxID=370354 RepID=B0EUX1_ENTDS|nr:uncharacterized protein EDI_247910 [Entamoeba dispar SAW760]EDR21695.1 hypothetical protein, conserved [Entamoeba dispar SAW760]|eukprot:EDR21695.1 hypothetical protein, conserved [Entamoeba dispar SAW760]